MWAAFIRQFAAYAITRRGKKLFALIGVLGLCFGAALLIDMQFYLSAGFVTLLAGFSALAYVVQHVKLKRAERERLIRRAEDARRRALAAQARLERIDNARAAFGHAKSAFGNAVYGAAQSARSAVAGAANEAVAVASESVEAVSRAANAVAEAINDAALRATDGLEQVARAGLVQAVRGWRALRGGQGAVS